METCTYAAPTLGVRIHSPIHIPHPLRKCSTPTLGEDTQKYSMSYSTNLIKLQLFKLILPIVISAIKGWLMYKKRDKKKERGQKSQCKKKKDNQVLVLRLGRYVILKEQL